MKIAVVGAALTLALAPAALAQDYEAPVVSGLRATPKPALSFSVSEYALVRVVIRHRTHTVGSIEHAFMPGSGRIAVGRVRGAALPHGGYTATVTANDAAHNRSAGQVVRFRVG